MIEEDYDEKELVSFIERLNRLLQYSKLMDYSQRGYSKKDIKKARKIIKKLIVKLGGTVTKEELSEEVNMYPFEFENDVNLR